MKILSIVGTRPNFMKISPVINELNKNNIPNILVHTGQHYDKEMSEIFFDDLGLPRPDINLGVGSKANEIQTGETINKLDIVIRKEKPDLVIVVGDVNSTVAGAIVSKQLGIKIAHVESGLRSFDLSMPEEINRMLTDRFSDFLFTTEESANINLKNEGIDKNKIHFVGNVMIDTLLSNQKKSSRSKVLGKLGLKKKDFCILTLHRPSNVDFKQNMDKIISLLEKIQEKIKIIFPMHPRTKLNIKKFGFGSRMESMENLIQLEPVGYLDFMSLMSNSKFVITDSGGIQEETSILGIPCITLRDNTERPVTVEQGTNIIVSTDQSKIMVGITDILQGRIDLKGAIPEKWDGRAAERIVKVLMDPEN